MSAGKNRKSGKDRKEDRRRKDAVCTATTHRLLLSFPFPCFAAVSQSVLTCPDMIDQNIAIGLVLGFNGGWVEEAGYRPPNLLPIPLFCPR